MLTKNGAVVDISFNTDSISESKTEKSLLLTPDRACRFRC